MREGNVFTGVCLSFCGGGGGGVGTSHASWGRSHRRLPPLPCISDLGPTPPPSQPHSRHQTWGPPLPQLLTSAGHHWRPVQSCSLEDLPPLILTSSCCHRNTYRWQAGCTHTTGMLSCLSVSYCTCWPTFLGGSDLVFCRNYTLQYVIRMHTTLTFEAIFQLMFSAIAHVNHLIQYYRRPL